MLHFRFTDIRFGNFPFQNVPKCVRLIEEASVVSRTQITNYQRMRPECSPNFGAIVAHRAASQHGCAVDADPIRKDKFAFKCKLPLSLESLRVAMEMAAAHESNA